MGALIDIEEVALVTPRPSQLAGGHLDRPQPGQRVEARALEVMGWALGRESPAIAAELWCEGRLVRRVPLGMRRADLQAAFPDVPEAERAGFRTRVSAFGREPAMEIEVRVVLADQRRLTLGTIRGRRRWREGPEAASPLVSVVIPCYQQAHFLPEAIESVLAQTYPHLEIVVVDDGSQDNTSEVAGAYPGVRVIRQDNQGPAAARNAGLRGSRGEYLVFLDADDRLLPAALEAGLAEMGVDPARAFVAGHYRHIDLFGEPVPTPRLEGVAVDHYGALLRTNWTGTPSACVFRRGPLTTIGGFDEGLVPAEDYDVCLRLARRHPVGSHDSVVVEYRRHGGSLSGDPGRMLHAVMAVHARQARTSEARRRAGALRAGRRFWRSYYGPPLIDQTRAAAGGGSWSRALRGALVLARHHPAGLATLLLDSLAPRRTPTSSDGRRTAGAPE